jgi:hypothetical protein
MKLPVFVDLKISAKTRFCKSMEGFEMFKKLYNHKLFPRLFYVKPDGGKDSGVTGYFLIEWKALFSVGFLRFKTGSREAYHNHAFNAVTFWIAGDVIEKCINGETKSFKPSLKPKFTKRSKFHKVIAIRETWAITFRGPWVDYWNEFKNGNLVTLTHGRNITAMARRDIKDVTGLTIHK